MNNPQDSICNNFIIPDGLKLNNKYQSIGYSNNSKASQAIFITMPCLALFINIILLLLKIYSKLRKNTNKKFTKYSTPLDINVYVLIITETIASILLIINSVYFFNLKSVEDNCVLSSIISIAHYFINIFNLIFNGFTVYHLKKMILDPIEGILKGSKNIKISIIITLVVSFLLTIFLFISNLIGYSPLLTPYIKTYFLKAVKNDNNEYDNDIIKYLELGICLLAIIVIYVYILYMIISIFFSKHFRKDKDLVFIHTRFVVFAWVVILCYTPLIILYCISINKEYFEDDSSLKYLSFASYFLTSIQGLLISIIRIVQNYFNYNKIFNNYICNKLAKALKLNNYRSKNKEAVNQLNEDTDSMYINSIENKIILKVNNKYYIDNYLFS